MNGATTAGVLGERGPVAYFARNRVAANVLMLLLLGGGLFASSQLAVERFPEYDPHAIVVSVPYPGATQSEIEEDITRRIEESVSGIVGVERVLSTAAEGIGRVTVEYEPFANAIAVLNAVRTAVERIENFPPPNAEQPEVLRSEVVRKVLTLAVSSSGLDEDGLRRDAERLRDELLALPSVSIVSLQGARDREIQIELSEEALRRLNLTIDRVVSQIQQASINLSGGELRTDAGEVVLSTITKRSRAEDFADIELVALANGAVVRLRDVAVLRDGFVDEELISEIDGRPTVFVRVDADVGPSGAGGVGGSSAVPRQLCGAARHRCGAVARGGQGDRRSRLHHGRQRHHRRGIGVRCPAAHLRLPLRALDRLRHSHFADRVAGALRPPGHHHQRADDVRILRGDRHRGGRCRRGGREHHQATRTGARRARRRPLPG